MTVEIGKPAPDFQLSNQDNHPICLSDYRGHKVVLFFFPKANEFSFGCIAQACAFRDEYDDLKDANAVVLGVSSDKPLDLKVWREKRGVKYDLLSDAKFEVHSMYGTKTNMLGGLPIPWTNRSYFVIDENGVLVDMEIGTAPVESAHKALATVKRLNAVTA